MDAEGFRLPAGRQGLRIVDCGLREPLIPEIIMFSVKRDFGNRVPTRSRMVVWLCPEMACEGVVRDSRPEMSISRSSEGAGFGSGGSFSLTLHPLFIRRSP